MHPQFTAFVLAFLSVLAPVSTPTPSLAMAPGISITTLPAYGSVGSAALLVGAVSGVSPSASYGVAVYIYVEGLGWWLKPYANWITAVAANGSFSAFVVTGGLDRFFTAAAVYLLPPGFVGSALPTQSSGLPVIVGSLAVATAPRYGPTLSFAGRTFAVKEAPLSVGPGSNVFSANPASVFVDTQGRLHLSMSFNPMIGRWTCTEVMLTEQLGLGTYLWTTESPLGQLDPALVFGAFTWDRAGDASGATGNPNREWDIEHSRWGIAADPTTFQTVNQPYGTPGNLSRFTVPPLVGSQTLTHIVEWSATLLKFTVVLGRQSPATVSTLPPSSILCQNTYVHNPSLGHYVPVPGRENFRFNLWIHGIGAAFAGPATSVIVSDFRFSPTPGVFRAGCGINPRNSLAVVSGSPTLGSLFVVGIDGVVGGLQQAGASATLCLSASRDAAFPCGTQYAGLSMTGGPAELLIVPDASMLVFLGAAPWTGSGIPVPFAFQIPNIPALVGLTVYTQGFLCDSTQPLAVAYGLTDALEVQIRP